MLNPYQAPPAIDSTGELSGLSELVGLFDDKQHATWFKGLRVIGWGHLVVLISTVALALMVTIQAMKLAQIPGSWALTSVISATVGLLVIWLGVIYWTALAGTERWFAVLVLVLQMVAMLALGAFLSGVLRGRFSGGLFMLFGASAFAMLLISQAIVALLHRSLAVTLRNRSAVHASELAVVGYAICATLCSANALEFFPLNRLDEVIAYATLATGIAALVAQTVANQSTSRSLRTMVERLSSIVHHE